MAQIDVIGSAQGAERTVTVRRERPCGTGISWLTRTSGLESETGERLAGFQASEFYEANAH
jgi:hypothetical protein